MKTRTSILIGGTLVAALVVGGGTAWAVLDDHDALSQRGTCDALVYDLGVETEDGVRELDYELQTTEPGRAWELRVLAGDVVVLEGERTTDPDGEIDLDVAVPEAATYVVESSLAGTTCVAELRR
ncbi:hypothetical protein [Nocardioides sp.]|uniref:hypothetical protein n=1 Tax=Nocardioides sp. TaxID=35761 RepID=UPI003519D3C4